MAGWHHGQKGMVTDVLKSVVESGEKINLEYSLEGLMLKLKLQYFGHLMQTASKVMLIIL